MDLESLPSSQATIADEEESREYVEEDDDKCANCKIVALKMKMSKNKLNQQAKEIKYLKDQRLVEKHLHEEKVKKKIQETIIKTEESTMLRQKVCKLENDFAESEKQRMRLKQEMIELKSKIERDQREKEKENESEVRHLKMKNKSLQKEREEMGRLIKSLSTFYEKGKERSTNSEGVLTPEKRKHNEN